MRRPSLLHRAVALILTWALPGSSAVALTPGAFASVPAAWSIAGSARSVEPLIDEAASGSDSSLEILSAPETTAPNAAFEGDDNDDALRPILECVVRNSSTSYTAYFGFKNETSQALSIPVGPSNAFSPAPQNRSQPTTFPKGRSPVYPNAAFAVPFNGSNLTWTLRGPDRHARTVTASASSPRCQVAPTPTPTPTATPLPSPMPPLTCASPVLNARRFTRTCDDSGPTVYNQTFTLSSGANGPYTLRVVNGDTQGRNKTTSAEVKINGVQVVGESDFSNTVVTFTKTVPSLLATNHLYVRVKGAPGSTFTLEICGATQGDAVPPSVDWLSPLEGELLRDPAPLFRVRYSDLVSAPNLSTLRILLDGVDQTASYNKQPDEASFDSTTPLSDGAHSLRAEIKDQAGNLGVGTRSFRIDATSPTISVPSPPNGAITNVARPQIRLSFADLGVLPSGIDTASLAVSLDGLDITASLAVASTAATGLPPTALLSGPHRIEATVGDRAGNTVAAASLFIVDTVPPVITTLTPALGQVLGASSASILVQYSDNDELNLASFTATVDGSPISMLVDADSASGTAASLRDGFHSLILTIADRAGNSRTTTTTFATDTGKPEIVVVPANGELVNVRNPEIVVRFSDAQGIAPGSLKITVNGVDRTASFAQTASEARATLSDLLPEGSNTIAAEVRDNGSNLGSASTTFIVDATPPSITIQAPAANGFLNDPTPEIQIAFSDALTGAAPATTRVFVDAVDVTSDMVLGPAGASGAFSTPLSEGAHTLEVTVADRAGNPVTTQRVFHIDLTSPMLDMASPRVDGFTSDATPEIWLRTVDPQGPTGALAAGVDAASIRVFLLSEDPQAADIDITALLTVGARDTRGEFVAALTDGSHRLKALARDLAGNESSVTAGFVVDTTSPRVTIDQPQSSTFLGTSEATIVLLYSDERSGIDSDLVQVKVDGIARAASLVPTATGASLTLSRSLGLSLPDGPHLVEARVVDRAGNASDAVPVTFGVDTVTPTATMLEPAGLAFVGTRAPAVHFKLQDGAPSSGINPSFARLLVDGVDITGGLSFTSTGGGPVDPVVFEGVGTIPMALGDGVHTLRLTAIDNANNPVELISQFTVDTVPPVITPEIPEAGRTIGGGSVAPGGTALVTGTLNDLDPRLTISCSVGGVSVAGSIANGAYSCSVPVTEGSNQVTIIATDSTGHSTTTTRDLTVDRVAPVVVIDSPSPGDSTAAQFISVAGHVQDATAVTVVVNGVTAAVIPASRGVPATFVASNVAVGPGPSVVFTAVATDAAANTGQAMVNVIVDRVAPVVTITKPATGTYLKAGLVQVELDVTDQSATMTEVNGTVAFDPACTGQAGVSLTCHFMISIPLVGDGVIVATARDPAGNVGHAQTNAILDSTPPNIVVTSPGALLVTNATTLQASGLATDASPFTITVNGQTVTVAADGTFNASIPIGAEGQGDVVFVATDAAGNRSTTAVPIIVDRTAPALTIASPLPGAVIPSLPAAVSGTVVDATAVTMTVQGASATVIGQAYSAALAGASEGPLTITVRAVDAAGNESTLTRVVEIDLAPPTIAITSPAAGTVTREAVAIIAYSVLDRSRTSITVNGAAVTPDCPGVNACDLTRSVTLVEGDNTFTVAATDAGGRTATAQVTITRDSTPPVVELHAPETVSRGRAGAASGSATDNLALDRIEIRLGSTVICTGSAQGQVGAPSVCSGAIEVPETARPGDALTVTAEATDRAGNKTTTSRSIRVTADGVVTGTVLNDTTSLPLVGATVALLGANARSTTTDAQGRYNIPVADTSAILRIEKTGMTSADRVVSVVGGTGTVPLDARLTPLAATSHVTATSPPTVGSLTFALPDGDHRVTPLSAQGLPNPLPPGFSPLAAFHWTTDIAVGASRISMLLPAGARPSPEAAFVRYDTTMRDWRVMSVGIVATDALPVFVDLAGPGSYALVVPDMATPPIVIGAFGEALTGLAIFPIPATATSESSVNPAILPPTGGTAVGSLRLDSPSSLPSGTIVQADIEETYTLASGEQASAPKRSMDVITYKQNALSTTPPLTICATSIPDVPVEGVPPVERLCAAFPITPSRTYATNSLREGRVHIDLLAGRENARGIVGGNEATSLTSGAVRLNVPAGGLPEDTAMTLIVHDTFSVFPNTSDITPLAEVSVDFFGATLNASASLTFMNMPANAGDALVLARVDRAAYDGIARLQVVALGDAWPRGGADPSLSVTTRVDTGLPGLILDGITQTGRYILFRLSGPAGFIVGSTAAGGSPVRALVSTNSLPFVAASNTSGAYAIPAYPGLTTVTARVLGSSLEGKAQATAINATPIIADIALQGTVTQAKITPASGANNVEVNQPLTLTSPVAIDLATVTAANIKLRTVPRLGSTDPSVPVALRFVLSGSGKQLSIIPQGEAGALPFLPPTDAPTVPPPPGLNFSTDYVLEITGLQDVVGGLVTAPNTTFRTQVFTKKVYNLASITFSTPDANGLITVSAPNGTLDPGTTVLIINGGNGVVLGLTAGNDGQLLGSLPAGIDDILFVTVTDPFGNATTFQRSEFVDPVTGETAVGAFGGTVHGPSGSALEIPEQALDKGTKFKLDFLTPEAIEQAFPGQQPSFGLDGSGQAISHVGGALKVEVTAGQTAPSKEIDLVFPIPSNLPAGADPKKAFYYVYQRVEGPCPNDAATCVENQRQYFLRTLDHAFVECASSKPDCDAADLRVRTASPPFNGFDGAFAFSPLGFLSPVGLSMNILVWTFNELLPGQPQAGAITGYVYQPERVRVNGVDKPVFKPVAGARVSGHDASGQTFMNGSQVEAITSSDGRFTLFDPRYVGGPFTLSAKHFVMDPVTGSPTEVSTTADGFESDPEDAKAIEIVPTSLRQYRNRAVLNLSFPAIDPPPPVPDIDITVCEITPSGCVPRNDLALVGRRLRIRADVSVASGARITDGEVNGASANVVTVPSPDSARARVELQVGSGPGGDTAFTPSAPGPYVVRVRAITAQSDPRVETLTFRVVGSTGAVTGLPDDAPGIITHKTLPQDGAANVSVTNLNPEIYFTEPVRGLGAGDSIRLDQVTGDSTGAVEFDLIGVGVDGNGVPTIIRSVAPTSLMTSVTLKPKRGLKLGAKYTLSLSASIVDTDDPPKPLTPYSTSFSTFTPSVQGSEGGFASPGIGLVGNLAFVVRNNFYNGNVSVWDVQDPALPKNLTVFPLQVAPRPIDVSADPAGAPMAAVSVVSTNASKPSSVVFVGAEHPSDPQMTGAVTVATSAQDGFISRTAFHNGFVYLATTKKGIQVVDVARGQNIPDLATNFQARVAINTDGRSFGEDALVRTIPYPPIAGYPLVNMTDIEAADIQGQTLVAATGALPLLLVDPQIGTVSAQWQPNSFAVTPEGSSVPIHLLLGYAIGLGKVGAYDLAVLVALVDEAPPASKVRLFTIDVRNPLNPSILGTVDLRPDGGPVDVTLRGTTAIVTTQKNYSEGEAVIVELVDPAHPYIKGRLAGAGGRAAINQDGQVVTTGISPFGGPDTPLGGVHSLLLESACTGLGSLQTARVVQYRIFDPTSGDNYVEDARILLDLCQRSQVTVTVNGLPLTTEVDSLPLGPVNQKDLAEGSHSILVPRDLLPKVTDIRDFSLTIKSVIDETERTIQGKIVGEIRNRPMLPVSHTFVKGVDLYDGHLSMGATDIQVKGRHLSIDVSRSYSSAGLGEGGSGWNWTYDAVISQANGVYNVVTADGSSQRFTRSGDRFVPQKGYHAKLAVGGEGQMIFTDKAANQHTFQARTSDTWVSGPWRLVSVEEPHGDMLKIAYNKLDRVDNVKEYHVGSDAPASSVTFFYEPFRAGTPGEKLDPKDTALSRIVGESTTRTLSLSVEYEHSENGELRKVTRKGTNIGSGQAAQDEAWQYTYVPSTGRDANRIDSSIDPDGHVTRYEFSVGPGFSPSEGQVPDRMEFVKKVIQIAGGGFPDVVTEFDYGARSIAATSSTTAITDSRGNATTYTMNEHGGVTSIAEPLSRTTSIQWMTTDALKESETLPGGILKAYEYDVNGNMTKETVTGVGGSPVAITSITYDPRFNKPKSQTDPNNQTTIWTIDRTTGDVTTMTNAVGDLTTYGYDPGTGLLNTETDPRGAVTTYVQDTDLGMWKSRTSQLAGPVPSSITASRTLDARGRVTRETDGVGGETVREYDGLDRPVVVRRVATVTSAGGASEIQDPNGEVTRVTYTKGGQAKTTTNVLGAVTTNLFDGLNRVTGTFTPVTGGTSTVITTATEYDGNGNVTKTTDPRGVVKQLTYDALNRLSRVEILSGPAVGPLGAVASYTYKGTTDVKETETDISGNTTTFVHDGLFRVIERQAPVAGYVEHFDYDLVGNVVRQADANGKVTKTDYDRLNRAIKVTRDFGGPAVVYVETKYEESSTSHVLKTEEYDSQKKLRVRYANDVAGRVRAKALLLEGAGSVEGRAGTAAHAQEASTNAGSAALFGTLPTALVRYIEAFNYEVGTTGAVEVAGAVGQTILEPSRVFDDGSPRSSRVGVDGLGREVFRTRGVRPALTTTYNGLGGKTEVKDENGNVTSWRYDTAGRMIGMTDAESKAAAYVVDNAGNRVKETDRRGVIKTFEYDNLNRLVKTTIPGSLTGVPWSETTLYLDASRQRRVTDARGTATLTTNDGLGRPRTITQFGTEEGGGNRTRETTYDGADKKTESDWLGRITTLEYDGLHRVTKAMDTAPFAVQTVVTTYDDANNRTVLKDRRGYLTVTQHDSLGRVVWIHRGDCDVNGGGALCETVERNEFDGSGNKVLTADGREHKTRFGYDDANRLIAREDGFEAAVTADRTTTRFELDSAGRTVKEYRGRLAATEPAVTYGYDKVNRVVGQKNGESEETKFGYDGEGNRTTVKPPAQPIRSYDYDELGKLVSVTLPATEDYAIPAITRYGYDENRNKTSQTDARGNTTTYRYDRANRLTSMLEPGNLTTANHYDANGNVLVMTDAKNQTETSTYDELNRKKSTLYTLPANTTTEAWREVSRTTYNYDENSNRTEAHEFVASGADPPMDRATIHSFDALDRVLTETTTLPDGGTEAVRYEYFPNGTRKAVILDGKRTAYEYDAQNRVKTMTTSDALVTTYTYYPDDLLQTTTTPDGKAATRTYDKADRLLSLANAKGTTPVSTYAYTYDHNGNRLTQTETNLAAELTSYTYDNANRLKSVTYPADSTYPHGRKVTYTYDKAGNRERETETTTADIAIVERAGTFDLNNRLTILNTTAAAPTVPPNVTPEAGPHENANLIIGYDNNGNETSRLSTTYPPQDAEGNTPPPTVLLTQSIYDLKDRLVEQKQGAQILTRHEYDADGRRTKKIGEEGIRQYVYDDTSLLAEYNQDGVEIAKYDYGADRLIRLTRADEGTRYMTFDGLGSVTGLTNPSGDVTATYHLDAWGNYRFTSELETSHNRFGFTGHYWDKEASLYYAKARYYDPFTARFTQADSFLGTIDDPPSLHRYQYAAANPTFFVDLDGHALTEAQKREFFAQMKGNLQGVNSLANQVAKPVAERGQGLFEFVTPGGFGRIVGEGNSETNTIRNYQGHMLDGRQSVGGLERTADYATSLLLQPIAMLEDVGRAIGSIPGRLARAANSMSEISAEDSLAGKAYQMTSAVQDVANSTEIAVGSYVGAKAGAVVVTEARSAVASARGSIQRFSDGLPGRNLLNGEIVMSPGGPLMASLPTIRPKGGAGPVRKGQAGVALTIAKEEALGNTVVSTEVVVDTSASTVRLDVVSRTPEGALRVIDSKNGPKAGFTGTQKRGYPVLEQEGGVPRGPNAEKAGFKPGERLPPTTVIIDRHGGDK